MEKRQHILILGNSLILGALSESLRRGDQFELTSLALPDDFKELQPITPDAILFDLETPHLESIFSLSERYAKLLLVGISPDTNIVRIWSGQQMRELSMQGLLTVIKDQLSISLVEGGVV
jgi:hypothetical protein